MKYIKLTQNKRTLVDNDDYVYLCQLKWCFGSKGYAICNLPRKAGKRQTLRMHRYIMNCPDNMEVDHINGNRLDNRKENLRIVNRQQNQINRNKHKKASSKYKGVTKRSHGWEAKIVSKGKAFYIGSFKTEEAAAEAYNNIAMSLHGEYARINKL